MSTYTKVLAEVSSQVYLGNSMARKKSLSKTKVVFGCMFLSCHVRVSEWIHSSLNVKELLAWSRRGIWSLSEVTATGFEPTTLMSHTCFKKNLHSVVAWMSIEFRFTLKHAVWLKWLSVHLRAKWLWVRISLLLWLGFRSLTSLTCLQAVEVNNSVINPINDFFFKDIG